MGVLIKAIECFILAVVFGLLPVGIGFMLGRIIKKEDEYQALLARAMMELRAFKAKYSMLEELREILDLIA